MPTRNRLRVDRLMKKNPHCYWCNKKVIVLDDPPSILPHNYATIDHLYSRLSPQAREQAMQEALKRGDGAGVYYVLSCNECNTKKGEMKPSTFRKKTS